jgi:hypothetical protein
MGQIDNGNGTTVDINSKREMKVFAVTETEAQASLELGNAYNLNTKDVTGLTAGDATLIYLYNDEDHPIIIEQMIIGTRGMTGLSDMAQWTTIANPTGGDLITDATTTNVIRANRLGGTSEDLKATTLVYKGKAAGTVTGGTEELYGYISNNKREPIPIGVEVARGGSYAVKIESDATAGTCYCALVVHVKDPAYIG